MNSDKITEVLDVLVGSTNPIGVTEYDEEVIEFIDEWCGGKEMSDEELDNICKRALS